jgi:hypothetical protein
MVPSSPLAVAPLGAAAGVGVEPELVDELELEAALEAVFDELELRAMRPTTAAAAMTIPSMTFWSEVIPRP